MYFQLLTLAHAHRQIHPQSKVTLETLQTKLCYKQQLLLNSCRYHVFLASIASLSHIVIIYHYSQQEFNNDAIFSKCSVSNSHSRLQIVL